MYDEEPKFVKRLGHFCAHLVEDGFKDIDTDIPSRPRDSREHMHKVLIIGDDFHISFGRGFILTHSPYLAPSMSMEMTQKYLWRYLLRRRVRRRK